MYKSPLKLMIQDGKRLNIADVLISYSYNSNGAKTEDEDLAYIDFIGVNDSGSNFIGRQYLVTNNSYIANTKLSITVGGFVVSDINYIYYIFNKGINVDKCNLDKIKFNYVISDLVLITTPYEIIPYLGFLRMAEIQKPLAPFDLELLRMAEIQESLEPLEPFEGAMLRMDEIQGLLEPFEGMMLRMEEIQA